MPQKTPARLMFVLFLSCVIAGKMTAPAAGNESKNILFVGNSFTAWNYLPDVIKEMALAKNPKCEINATQVVLGGQTLKSHWDSFDTAQWLRITELTVEEQEQKCAKLAEASEKHKTDRKLRSAFLVQRRLLSRLKKQGPTKWDYVVLQSYGDTQGGMKSDYAEYARKFAAIANKQGARVILYGTAVRALNGQPLDKAPDASAVRDESRLFAELSRELNALVVPVFLGVNNCQRADPRITFRWVKNSHPNQRCTYLTALIFYSVLFDRNPAGVPINKVCFRKTKGPDTDPDGNPRCVVFTDAERAFYQRIAWESVQGFRNDQRRPDQ